MGRNQSLEAVWEVDTWGYSSAQLALIMEGYTGAPNTSPHADLKSSARGRARSPAAGWLQPMETSTSAQAYLLSSHLISFPCRKMCTDRCGWAVPGESFGKRAISCPAVTSSVILQVFSCVPDPAQQSQEPQQTHLVVSYCAQLETSSLLL